MKNKHYNIMPARDFDYIEGRFADVMILRYRLDGFEKLSLRQKKLIYCLSQAALYGRDITFDQFGRYNLRIRKVLEAVYAGYEGCRDTKEFKAFEEYLKRVWFSSGIYHHYGYNKFKPGFTEDFFISAVKSVDEMTLPLEDGQTVDGLCRELVPVMFDESVQPVKVSKKAGEDIIKSSACNFYDGVSQEEAEEYYESKKDLSDSEPLSYGLNSTLVKDGDRIYEDVWHLGGKYGKAIGKIVFWLERSINYAENDRQADVIEALVRYYKTGDLRDFNSYCVEWVADCDSLVDFINGFIEVYDDPLGLKGTWEGIVEFRDIEGSRRTHLISNNAQWFEDNSPVDPRFKKNKVNGISANVICAAMLGGGEYPSTAIGINLPNADWIRANHGSKSVTISNIISAYNEAARGNGFYEEFVVDAATVEMLRKYGDVCDVLHTDLHECVGHGSGQLLPNVSPDALRVYGNTLEEARADLFGLYYVADKKMIELGLLPDENAYKAGYYSYIMNGLLTQLARIRRGGDIEEAHMRDRALIARWCYEHGRADNVIEILRIDGKTYVKINDYERLRGLFGDLLAEVQRIKSEGDYDAARSLVERYGVSVDRDLHEEILERYARLDIPPYKGFVNPVLIPIADDAGNVVDIRVDYSESYVAQMMRYSKIYSTLI